MRKLGLDVGSKSCGIALTDKMCITAQGKENFFFEEHDWDSLIERVKEYLTEYEITLIVIGLPTLKSGDPSFTTFMIQDFANELSKQVNIPYVFEEENFSTKQAFEIMSDMKLSIEQKKKLKDQFAAQIILQNHLKSFK